jgi:hypothetical protein
MHWAVAAGGDRRGRNGRHRLPATDAHFIVEHRSPWRLRGETGFCTRPFGSWVSFYKGVLRISVIVVVTLVLVLWDRRTGKVIIGQTLAVLVALDH